MIKVQRTYGKKFSSTRAPRLKPQLPDDLWAFCTEINGMTFRWVHKDHQAELNNYSEGYNGGYINLQTVEKKITYYPPQEWEDEEYGGSIMLDSLQPEGFTQLQFGVGKTPKDAYCAFNNANDCTISYISEFDEYIQSACQNAFTWYWPAADWEGADIQKKLKAASIGYAENKAEIPQKFEALGMSASEAAEMAEWLGEAAVFLLEK